MKKKNLTETIYQDLRSRIVNFRILSGVKISDKDMAQAYGISRTPVREALFRLSEQGLVEVHPNQGFRVRIFTSKDVEDLYRVREALESLAISLAMKYLDHDFQTRAQANLADYPHLIEHKDLSRFNDADTEFHALIAAASRNQLLEKNLHHLADQVMVVRHYEHLRIRSLDETYLEHQTILDFMLKGQEAEARKAMSRHILTSAAEILKVFPDRNDLKRDIRNGKNTQSYL